MEWSDYKLQADRFFSISCLLAWIRVLELCLTSITIGPLQISLSKMVDDVFRFLVVFLIISIGFACATTQIYYYYKPTSIKKIDSVNFCKNDINEYKNNALQELQKCKSDTYLYYKNESFFKELCGHSQLSNIEGMTDIMIKEKCNQIWATEVYDRNNNTKKYRVKQLFTYQDFQDNIYFGSRKTFSGSRSQEQPVCHTWKLLYCELEDIVTQTFVNMEEKDGVKMLPSLTERPKEFDDLCDFLFNFEFDFGFWFEKRDSLKRSCGELYQEFHNKYTAFESMAFCRDYWVGMVELG